MAAARAAVPRLEERTMDRTTLSRPRMSGILLLRRDFGTGPIRLGTRHADRRAVLWGVAR
jgi:hypothetical protein